MNQNGFTMLEALLAVAILAIVLVGVLPAFTTFVNVNRLSEERSGAVAAGQLSMEALRQSDPSTLPDTGNTGPDVIEIGGREFEVVRRWCTRPALCDPESRHVLVEVRFGGDVAYTLESVFTALR